MGSISARFDNVEYQCNMPGVIQNDDYKAEISCPLGLHQLLSLSADNWDDYHASRLHLDTDKARRQYTFYCWCLTLHRSSRVLCACPCHECYKGFYTESCEFSHRSHLIKVWVLPVAQRCFLLSPFQVSDTVACYWSSWNIMIRDTKWHLPNILAYPAGLFLANRAFLNWVFANWASNFFMSSSAAEQLRLQYCLI